MTELLLRLFVKNYQNTENSAVRTAYGKLSGIFGIICNLLLFGGKFLIGTLSGSVSITADAVNNLSDAAGSIVTLLGFSLAAKPADDEHPYGHNRIEYICGLAVSALILIIGVELVKSSLGKILHPEAIEFSWVIVFVLVLSIAVKLLMALLNSNLSKRISSAALQATAADSRNDVISTAAVLIACLVGKYTGLMLDGYIGMLVALFILYSGVQIAKDTINPLLGMAPDEELVHTIAADITAHEGILGIHDLIVHDYGPGRRFASVHAEMDYKADVLDAHELIDNIEHEIKKAHNVELVIHYDPIVTDDAELNALHTRIVEILTSIDRRLAIHDFRMVRGTGHTNLIFDVVLPNDLLSKQTEIKKTVTEKIQDGKTTYYCVITFDLEAFNDPHTR